MDGLAQAFVWLDSLPAWAWLAAIVVAVGVLCVRWRR